MKNLPRNALVLVTTILLCISTSWSCESHDREFSEKQVLRTTADKLKTTVVIPHQESPIAANANVLWCASFQLAWNEACKLTGGELRFTGEQPPMLTELNRKSFSAGDLDNASYLALAGFVRDGIYDRIDTRLREHFSGSAVPQLLPNRAVAIRPQDIVVYSYLFKNLEFPVQYERAEVPLPFDKASVVCFGMGSTKAAGREKMEEQTLILDYVGPDDFVVELKTKSPGDRLILAKIPPEPTLAKTVAAVNRRVQAAQPAQATALDVLVIPKINFDITRSYTELVGRQIVPGPGVADDLQIVVADQNTRFQMDEKGVRLKSEARMSVSCAAEGPGGSGRRLIFDKPFLVTLGRADAKSPYFALWVANPELLIHAE